jgi:hypothetical protein
VWKIFGSEEDKVSHQLVVPYNLELCDKHRSTRFVSIVKSRRVCWVGHVAHTRTQIMHVEIWYVRWVPCHHGMARPQVADGGDALQLWREAANILNKQSQTADKGGPSAWGLGVRLTTPHHKE